MSHQTKHDFTYHNIRVMKYCAVQCILDIKSHTMYLLGLVYNGWLIFNYFEKMTKLFMENLTV